MAQPGHFLAVMMANLQSYLGPQGADVKVRDKFYNPETGRQIGEIDITVRGDFGTSKFLLGIECRDRPSNGPQGLPWIREVFGKKDQLNLDKIVAVSSTGFTNDAQEYATSKNIDFITIADPTGDVLREWFQILEFSYTDWRITAAGPVTLNLLDPNHQPPDGLLNFNRMIQCLYNLHSICGHVLSDLSRSRRYRGSYHSLSLTKLFIACNWSLSLHWR